MLIKGFIKTSFVDWAGKITAVIFLPNCNFRCPYCQNPDLVLNSASLLSIELSHIISELNQYKGWVDGVCITGGEPTIHEDLPELIRTLRKNVNVAIKLDTNGSNPKMLERMITEGLLDAVSMDIKAPLDDIRYYKAAGVAVSLEDIKKSIDILRHCNLDIEFRTTVHPKLFTKKDIEDIATQLKGVKKYKLQNFNRNADTIDPSLKGTEPFTDEEFEELQKIVDKIIKGAA